MGIFDAFNIKKKLAEMEASDQEASVDIVEHDRPQSYSVFERSAMDISRLVMPESATWQENYFKVGDEYCRTLFIHTFPPSVEDNWLAPILRFQHAIDVAMYIQPLPIKQFLSTQRQQISMDHAALRKDYEDGVIANAKKEARLRDSTELVAAIEEDATKPFQVMIVMTIRAHSEKELDTITHQLETQLTAVGTRKAQWRHKQGFDTTLPLLNNELRDMQVLHTLHTQALMASFPFSASDITHETGVLIGVSQFTNAPIVLNRFMQPEIESPNTVVFGASGSGKSFFAKLEMIRWACKGIPIMVLDPSGEYRRVCAGLGGANIDISLDSGDRINPLDFSHAVHPNKNALREKVTYMVELIGVMIRGDNQQGSISYDSMAKKLVSNALQEVYRAYQYNVADVGTQLHATSERMPTLSDLHFMLERIQRTNRDAEVQRRLSPLLAALDRYVGDGDLAPLFDNRTTIDTRSHFINFNYASLPSEYLPMAMHLVLEFIRTSMLTEQQQQSGQNRLIYVDEAQILMGFPETAHFLGYMFRTCRKFGIGATVLTQNVGVFWTDANGEENKVGRAILANSPIKVLLKQEPAEADAVKAAFKMSDEELAKLLSAGYGEGIVLVGRDNGWFTAVGLASDEEYAMLTTNTSERAQIDQAAQALLNPADEEEQRFFRATELPSAQRPALPPDSSGASSPFDSDPFANDDDGEEGGFFFS